MENLSGGMMNSIEVSIKGKWSRVPALTVDGKNIVVKGRWIRKAIVDAEEWQEDEVRDPESFVRELQQRRSALRADMFTFSQKLPNTSPQYSYPMEWQSVAAVSTEKFSRWWDELPQTTRKNVRRSEKRAVVIEVKSLDDELIRAIIGVNNDSPVRQRVPFSHYGKTFDQVKKDQSSFLDRSDYICAYVGNELIGFLKLVYRGNIASILQLLPRASEQDRRPANALLAKAVELCAARGLAYLTYGLFNYGNKQDSPLREFKVRNGFSEILVPRYYVPITMLGALSIKTGLHRGLLGILPHRVITAGVNARAVWYDIKQKMSRCSSMSERPNCNRQMECSNPSAGSND